MLFSPTSVITSSMLYSFISLITRWWCYFLQKLDRVTPFLYIKNIGASLQRLYILTTMWVLRTPNAGRNMLFQCFLCKKVPRGRKSKIIDLKFGKNVFLKLNLDAGWGFCTPKWSSTLEGTIVMVTRTTGNYGIEIE